MYNVYSTIEIIYTVYLNDSIYVWLAEARESAAGVDSDQYYVIDMACIAGHICIFLHILYHPLNTLIDDL